MRWRGRWSRASCSPLTTRIGRPNLPPRLLLGKKSGRVTSLQSLSPPCLQSVSPARVCITRRGRRRRVHGGSAGPLRGLAGPLRGPAGPAGPLRGSMGPLRGPAGPLRGPAGPLGPAPRARGTPRAGPAAPLRGRAGFAGRNIMFYMRCKTFLMTTSSLPPMWSFIFPMRCITK